MHDLVSFMTYEELKRTWMDRPVHVDLQHHWGQSPYVPSVVTFIVSMKTSMHACMYAYIRVPVHGRWRSTWPTTNVEIRIAVLFNGKIWSDCCQERKPDAEGSMNSSLQRKRLVRKLTHQST